MCKNPTKYYNAIPVVFQNVPITLCCTPQGAFPLNSLPVLAFAPTAFKMGANSARRSPHVNWSQSRMHKTNQRAGPHY